MLPQQFNIFVIMADAPQGYRFMPYSFRKLFSRATITA